ncbi:MAG: preprotein translocase subunit YajC [Eubacteriaceae bacterium]|jgi:preprotein translocase subunit YajC|nr:preprotein translocase subunit YajC [Eubacteriaceae bacterium]MDD4507882.1 preprotein translocase subunit YajC [Eubacteriaceae bacterium]
MNSNLLNLLPIVILAAFLYFVLIRPQSKQQKKMNTMLDHMKIGDEVMTAGGFYGIVNAMDDENVVLEMLPDFNKAMIKKTSIVKMITPEAEESDDDKEETEDKEEVKAIAADDVKAADQEKEPDQQSEEKE